MEDAFVDKAENIPCYKHYNTQAQQIMLNKSEIELYGAMKRRSNFIKVSIDTVKIIVSR